MLSAQSITRGRHVRHLARLSMTNPKRLLTVAGVVLLFAATARADETGSISGFLVDENEQRVSAGNAVVFLCDAGSGLPVLTTTKKPYAPGDRIDDLVNHLSYTVTNDRGDFEFQEVPVGRYRLVAQSWSGTNGFPDIKSFKSKPSSFVILHGVAEGVEVTAGNKVLAYPKGLGSGVLKIVNDPEEPHAFLLISRNPRLGDGVLGPLAWGDKFLSGLMGVTLMEEPHVTLMGLPDGETIHVGLFNYDNNPGVGGDSYVVGKEKTVRLEIFATWSNGKRDPPKRLEKLTEYLEKNKVSVASLIGLKGTDDENREEILKKFRAVDETLYPVPGVGEYKLADLLAAKQYQLLREFPRKRGR